jgi:hypothetical protein
MRRRPRRFFNLDDDAMAMVKPLPEPQAMVQPIVLWPV